MPLATSSAAAARPRLTRALSGLRRAVLARRRPLAALLVAVATAAGLRAVTAEPPPTEPVLVAAHDLPAGATLQADDLATAQFAPGSAPDDLAGAEPDDLVGRVVAGGVRRGEPLTDVRLVGPQLADGLDDGLSGALQAVPVRFPDAGTVELLEVGDRIDLVATDPQEGGSRLVAVDVQVLAVPEAAGDGSMPGRVVVVGASTAQVGELLDASVRAFLGFAWSR